jgi:hypothetical protein
MLNNNHSVEINEPISEHKKQIITHQQAVSLNHHHFWVVAIQSPNETA